jgi:hypothetical protein
MARRVRNPTADDPGETEMRTSRRTEPTVDRRRVPRLAFGLIVSAVILPMVGFADRAEAGQWVKQKLEFVPPNGSLEWTEGQLGSRIAIVSHDDASFVVRRSWRGNSYSYRVGWRAPARVVPGETLPFALEVTCLEAVRGDLPPGLALTHDGAWMSFPGLFGQGDKLQVGFLTCTPGRSDPAVLPTLKVPAGGPGASFVAEVGTVPASWSSVYARTTYTWTDAAPPPSPGVEAPTPGPVGSPTLPPNGGVTGSNTPVEIGSPSKPVTPQPIEAPPSDWQPPVGGDGTAPLPPVPDPSIAENGVGGAVTPGVRQTTELTLREPYFVTLFVTYHYGARRPPGLIGLKHESGTWFGPWPAAGGVGQGGVPNAYWYVRPNIVLPAGRYVVFDSDPDTWTHEASTHGQGIYILRGHRP